MKHSHIRSTTGILAAAISSALLLSACNSSDDDNMPPTSDTAQFSLAVSDSPVDSADVVMVCFSGIELVGNGMGSQRYDIGSDEVVVEANDACLDANGDVIANTRGIDLLTLQGATAESLIEQAELPAGSYGQLRLDIADGSYVSVDGEQLPLRVPSDQLRLDGPTLSAGGTFAYTLEFDLRRALINPQGLPGYTLTPRGVRLVDNSQIGHLEGEVAELLLINNECSVAPADTREPVAAVYLFAGSDLQLNELAGNTDSDDDAYTSVTVRYDGVSNYPFEIGFIDQGEYFAALTCDTHDSPEEDNDIVFIKGQNVTISAGETATVSFSDND
ncbi:MAG: DUF4382 domain-containing protein [Idiomarina sp.]|nr:DUF4382 domain-containing protein [Idiomarina sp.]